MTSNGNFSVLLSVYKGTKADYLDQALSSIWDYQALKPSEIVLVQDGEVNCLVSEVITTWQKKLNRRFKWIKHNSNLGLAVSLNHGLEYCSYDVVARMDDDDIALPNRFKLQYDYMSNHPEVGVLGTQIEERDSSMERIIGERLVPENHLEIVKFAKYRSPINHPSVMYRKSIICKNGGYPKIFPEDYALWGKLITKGVVFHNLPHKLLKMRASTAILNRRGFRFFVGELKVLCFLYRLGLLNLWQFLSQVNIRFIVRISPKCIKMRLYKFSRK